MRSKYEILCEKELQEKGFFTDYKIRPSRIMRNAPVDYFHLGDILAIKQDEFKFISVKGKSCPSKHRKDLQRFANIVPQKVSVELWQYRNTKKKKVTIYEKT